MNDGERIVLKRLRDEIPDAWSAVSNFEVPSGRRMLECDAVVFSPSGWAYLVETKALVGQIEGNDKQWAMPSMTGRGRYFVPNPIHVLRGKVKKLASMLREHDARLADVRIYPLVVVVSNLEPRISGRSAGDVVLDRALREAVTTDPRPARTPDVADDLIALAVEVLTAHAQPISPDNRINAWELVELVDATDTWEVWSARNTGMGPNAPLARLKRYFLDTLATGDDRERQQRVARHDLDALIRLAGADGAVPVLSTVEETEDSIAVVTEWPGGPTLASLIGGEQGDAEAARDLVEAFVTAVASVHSTGVIHRRLSPSCAHVLPDGRVVLSDFDFSRIPGDPSITGYLPETLPGPYAATELQSSTGAASLRSDVWSAARISLEILAAWAADGINWELAPASWRDPLRQALADDPAERLPDAQVLLQLLRSGSVTAPAVREGFRPNDVLDGRWVVRTGAKSGGIADVYRVYDTELAADYAAKFLKLHYHGTDEIDVLQEYKRVEEMPPHRNVALPKFVLRLSSYTRGRERYDIQSRFLLTRWIKGESLLDTLTLERLPLARAVEITRRLASALDHLHSHELIHRDVKPANVIIDESGEPVLVDFNIAARIADAGHTAVGTPDYTPPDLATTGWSPAADTYMLAITACEMLAGTRLGRDKVGRWLETAAITPDIREVLGKATAPGAPRTAEPCEFAAALAKAAETALSRRVETVAPPLRVARDENHNPYRDEINRLFSQSRESNAGTRGLDEFAQWTYVPTRLDRELSDAILGGEHRLVLITGNAGDGKTAFIQMIEHELFRRGATVSPRPAGNGAALEYQGRRFETNWDGSQDEGDEANDDVLTEFFAPYAGEHPQPPSIETRLIAINEGRLLDFISDPDRRGRFHMLSRALGRVLEGTASGAEDWMLVVNLNLRALTLQSDELDGDIVAGTLERLSDERLWAPCASCRAREHCPANANAAQLRDPILGVRARERVRQVLDVVRLRRRIHITMRDLRSALAFMVVGNRACEEIVGLVDAGAATRLIAGRLPNAVFGAAPDVAALGDESATRDRLLAAIAPLDVARTADPAEDARLWALGSRALPPVPAGLGSEDRALLDGLRDEARKRTGPTQRELIAFAHGALRRAQFMEREGTSWRRMLPYERLGDFEGLLGGADENARDRVIRAISHSEGLFNEHFEGELGVSLAAEVEGLDRTYVMHPAQVFELAVKDEREAARYVEYAPDALLLRLRADPRVALELDLDLYETLGRILNGFVPSREELRGTWLNLRVFKDQLAAVPSDSLLLSIDDRDFYGIHREDGGDALALSRVS